ncbi:MULTISPECIES: bifunctional biotin--[acetyl-CoA-carboxylase] ligase/biotin operon repressor BirA [unclassified Vibrio]|uniref:Bifunctional ligase/repressor BirA n=1 Tax=Vibrio sp. HB236076 TaxID=3232307 RepID=A0AB39H9D1_9VIBR|nr:bifunctional biotin--[acetyl-CoA-carboxylase] ligase/biotin operon repressor BirA [Vibrio sp. HB161653]MDP5255835.1 bifunctional biotin--[acetyl-CoA-carboxylase] ligase/biotin operon repressor BirA [Vibrio sp. HB161653]
MSKTPTTKLAILQRIADGQFHSGEALGEDLGISRAAVAKHIKSLRAWGLDIYRVQGKGYCLEKPLQLLDSEKIVSRFGRVDVFAEIDSTNQYLMEQLTELEQGRVCLAEYQSAGRGRRGRKWVSPFGQNLYLSMYWNLSAGLGAAMGLSLAIGIATVEALEKLDIHGVKLKWPNDLYYQDKKLAGVLVELSGQTGGVADVVIGMGMNIAISEQDSQAITQPWSCIEEIVPGRRIDRNQLASALIESWHQTLVEYETSGLGAFLARWQRLDNYLGRPVRLIIGEQQHHGVMKGINEQGAVLLENDQGTQAFFGGEISMRGTD